MSDDDLLKKQDTFVWHKKLQSEGLDLADAKVRNNLIEKNIAENMTEIVKVKSRQNEMRDDFITRARKNAYKKAPEELSYEDWLIHERKFQFNQAKARSEIRLRTGRGQPIDFLTALMHQLDETDLDLDLCNPLTIMDKLSEDDLANLLEDVKFYTEHEEVTENNDFWNIMLFILNGLTRIIEEKSQPVSAGTKFVYDDIKLIFKGKNVEQLNKLNDQVSAKLASNNPDVDRAYWETVISLLKLELSRYHILDIYNLRCDAIKAERNSRNTALIMQNKTVSSDQLKHPALIISKKAVVRESYDSGRLSPTMEKSPQFLIKKWTPYAIYMKKLQEQRNYVLKGGKIASDKKSVNMYNTMKSAAMEEDESEFNQEIFASNKRKASEYQLIKPKFFNKVITGYDWNQYNLTHYDEENPPPKVVQGYRFNIFYPDLIDYTKTPAYTVYKYPENPDFAIIKFSGGPPYEDIAFKIVDGDWEFKHRLTFRCQFENSIFQLWFRFRKFDYKR